MDAIAGRKPAVVWALNISVVALVALWLFPTLGLLVSSFRTGDQITASGWWSSFLPAEQTIQLRVADPDEARVDLGNGRFMVEGNIFEGENFEGELRSWATSSRDLGAFQPGDVNDLGDGETLTVQADGSYVWEGNDDQISGRAQRVFLDVTTPPDFTLDNYSFVLFDEDNSEGMAKAFMNTLTVVIPATIIPILIAAFAAYALAWMDFPGRALLIAIIVGLLVVPLQLALIPLLSLHNAIGIGKGYLGTWLAHTGFGLPLAIYLLRNYMVGLPRDIIENAKVDGATDFQIFTKIILPLSFPALASFAIFQFLWTWNDLLVALVFLIDATGETTVMTKQIVELLGTRGGDWEILATSAFVSIAVPLAVFFAMQKYLVRGLLAGSVK
ncbi:maltose ABC transporter membrane protein /trehalose ABC transporter membrane protein /sucrose ABC transporter membrane protein [Loktanella sp. PT4BL]|jgi:alpha-glucoside transport system permease protein|uniref:carbohydrate ABC transporter permease n=1 Tax=Loktanella sp. PT4BL TaxID=2135611 RepID=UPI000D754FBF|nr:carbohydrate ABC transporter permease [Loktanella sp. PT4BL]PXW70565.1 maltose ABC transporter membrane protein /trehalose ABC transporter membrane protein /sucrose ABC transporter membrane protein [Loktanella sp. PT4BL]